MTSPPDWTLTIYRYFLERGILPSAVDAEPHAARLFAVMDLTGGHRGE